MIGAKTGVVKVVHDEEQRANLAQCYGHALTLAVGDGVKYCILMKAALDTVAKILKNSHQIEMQPLKN